jgi:hypothetical protein
MGIRAYKNILCYILLLLAGFRVQAQDGGPPPIPNFFCDSSGFYGSYGYNTAIDYINMELSIPVANNYKQHINSFVSIDYYSSSFITIQPQTLTIPLIDTGITNFVFHVDSLLPSDSVDRSYFEVVVHLQSATDSLSCTQSFSMQYGTRPHLPPYEMCDYLSLDSFELNDSVIVLHIKNNSSFVVLNPRMYAYNTNRPDIRFENDTTYKGLFLDTVGGVNSGTTRLSLPVYYLKDRNLLPYYNIFNFRFWLADSTGQIFNCYFDVNKKYGKDILTDNGSEQVSSWQVYCTSDGSRLTLHGDINGTTSAIYNTAGQLLYQQANTIAPAIIPISELPAGMYFAAIKKDGQMIVKKFIR